MRYSEFVEVYEALSKKPGRLEKISILSAFLKKIARIGKSKWIYLLKGKVSADYDSREFGISTRLTLKAISSSYGADIGEVNIKFNKMGDLGGLAEELASKKRQSRLFSSKLSVDKVFDNLLKMMEIEGKRAVEKKILIISELLGSASGKEAKYIVRTLMGDLKVGVADSTIRDAIAEAFFPDSKKEMAEKIGEAYDALNDFAEVLEKASKGKKYIEEIEITPGKPLNVMLAVKADSIGEGFEICGKPAAIEQKYDGFRMVISRSGNEIKLFTRRLEDVTNQFPDVVLAVKENVLGESFVLDSEVVGFDGKTGKYRAFQEISQRIKRKYNIEEIIKKLPVEVNVFDAVYYDGKNLIDLPFKERRKIVEKIVKEKKKVIRPAVQIISDNVEEVEKFYEDALNAGEEGIMIKNLNAKYKQGRKVGYMVKIKPDVKDLDLVIVGAEHGTGKRGGWLTSYYVACKSGDKFLKVGKVSSGLKEKEEEGTSYNEMTKMLKPLIIREENNILSIKPKVVVSVTYQNIQKSPSYDSGYALRFPRITKYRPDRNSRDIASLRDIEKEARKGQR